jgi:carboxylesterase
MFKSQAMNGGEDAVLLFHGLSSSPLELQLLGRGLQRAGYSVYLPHLPGYGDDGSGKRRQVTHCKDWVAQALHEYDAIQTRHARVAVGGLCIGALLALHVAAERPAVAAVTALSPTLWYDGWSLPWYSFMLPLASFVPFGKHYSFRERPPYGVKDLRMRAWIAREMANSESSIAGAATLTAPGLLEARRLSQAIRRRLKSVVAPTLVLHAVEDDMASPRSAEHLMRHLGAKQTRLVMLRDSYHMITLDQEKGHVLAEVRDFLDRNASQDAASTSPNNVVSLPVAH